MIDFWNQRYSNPNFAYGKQPNEFFKSQIQQLPTGSSLLCPAEGEGRNAVFAATQGLHVWAFDQSEQGKNKALLLADEFQTSIHYDVCDAQSAHYSENQFDAIALIYAHFHESIRHTLHTQFLHWLKPGGLIILEAFSQDHPVYQKEYPQVGGPSTTDLLYSESILALDFPEMETLLLKTEIIDLDEGEFHRGRGSVVRFVGMK